jgi:hypothetical protein
VTDRSPVSKKVEIVFWEAKAAGAQIAQVVNAMIARTNFFIPSNYIIGAVFVNPALLENGSKQSLTKRAG